MHGLTQIHIQNFRACKNVSLSLGSFTPLVGQNNVGKSTVLDAIRIALAPKALAKLQASSTTRLLDLKFVVFLEIRSTLFPAFRLFQLLSKLLRPVKHVLQSSLVFDRMTLVYLAL
ncbi:DNA replication and repair protein RecF [compost metagenome]